MKISKNFNFNIKTAQPIQQQVPQTEQQQAPQANPNAPQNLKPGQIRNFVMRLKSSVNTLASNLNKYENPTQALTEMQNIQTLTQQIIASIQNERKKMTVTDQQAIQQVRNPLVEE